MVTSMSTRPDRAHRDEGGGERGGIAVLLQTPSTDTRAGNVGEYVIFFLIVMHQTILYIFTIARAIIDIPCRRRHRCRERSSRRLSTIETRGGERGGELPSCYRRRQLTREPAEIQQPTGDGSGNSRRRCDGGRGGGCSGDSLCGGSGSGRRRQARMNGYRQWWDLVRRAKHVLIKRLNDVPCKGDVILLIPM
jgi:hypothetical protein